MTGKNPPTHRESAGNTTDHSIYCRYTQNGTQEKIHIRQEKSIHAQELYN